MYYTKMEEDQGSLGLEFRPCVVSHEYFYEHLFLLGLCIWQWARLCTNWCPSFNHKVIPWQPKIDAYMWFHFAWGESKNGPLTIRNGCFSTLYFDHNFKKQFLKIQIFFCLACLAFSFPFHFVHLFQPLPSWSTHNGLKWTVIGAPTLKGKP